MESDKQLTAAEKHYQRVKEAKKRYYEKKKSEKPASARPRGRPRKEHWVIETESEFLKNTQKVKVEGAEVGCEK